MVTMASFASLQDDEYGVKATVTLGIPQKPVFGKVRDVLLPPQPENIHVVAAQLSSCLPCRPPPHHLRKHAGMSASKRMSRAWKKKKKKLPFPEQGASPPQPSHPQLLDAQPALARQGPRQ